MIAFQRFGGRYPCGCPGECLFKSESLTDAELTLKGRRQASAAGASIMSRSAMLPTVVVASPLRRTLQTASIAVANTPLASLPMVALEGCRERIGVHVADKRSAVEDIAPAFPSFDFSAVAPGADAAFSDNTRETIEQIVERGRGFFWALRQRPEQVIAVFSHSSFLYNTIRNGFDLENAGSELMNPCAFVLPLLC